MDDCISRRAAVSRMSDLLVLDLEYKRLPTWNEVYRALQELPSVQPEVIRCKDCKNWDTTWTNDFAPNYHYCPMVDGVRKSDFYCANAERRTDE